MFLLLCLFSLPAYASGFSDRVTATNPPQKPAPLVFEDDHGTQHTLNDYRGAFVLLNIWATWCSPCVKEMASFEALQKSFDPKKLVIVPLSEDRAAASVSAFYRSHGLTHLSVAIDAAGIAPATLHLHGVPTTLILNPQGLEIARIEGGADWAAPDSLSVVNSLINNNK